MGIMNSISSSNRIGQEILKRVRSEIGLEVCIGLCGLPDDVRRALRFSQQHIYQDLAQPACAFRSNRGSEMNKLREGISILALAIAIPMIAEV
jgi:hypothetical protein